MGGALLHGLQGSGRGRKMPTPAHLTLAYRDQLLRSARVTARELKEV